MAKSLLAQSGVYAIQSDDDRAYVGSSIQAWRRATWHRARLRLGSHENAALQEAWTLLGEAAFTLTVVEFAPEDELAERERYWIDRLGALENGYNVAPVPARLGASPSAEFGAYTSAVQVDLLAKGKHPSAKLTVDQVVQIRQRLTQGAIQRELAEEFGVANQTISNINCGHHWRALVA